MVTIRLLHHEDDIFKKYTVVVQFPRSVSLSKMALDDIHNIQEKIAKDLQNMTDEIGYSYHIHKVVLVFESLLNKSHCLFRKNHHRLHALSSYMRMLLAESIRELSSCLNDDFPVDLALDISDIKKK